MCPISRPPERARGNEILYEFEKEVPLRNARNNPTPHFGFLLLKNLGEGVRGSKFPVFAFMRDFYVKK
jgi:hypothetical protein